MFSEYLTPCNFSLLMHVIWDDFFCSTANELISSLFCVVLAFEGHLKMDKNIQIILRFLISYANT